jgi:hypothetical protein
VWLLIQDLLAHMTDRGICPVSPVCRPAGVIPARGTPETADQKPTRLILYFLDKGFFVCLRPAVGADDGAGTGIYECLK